MNKFILLFSLFTLTKFYAQVGIGTTNPQKMLHIGGTTSTIRIDGLNAANNTNNLGGSLTTPIHVNSNGDLVIPPSPASTGLLFASNDILPTETDIATTGNGAYNSAQLYKQNFTLSRPALVIVNYTMGYLCQTTTGTTITDGRAKVSQNWFRFGDGTIATSPNLAITGQTYTNSTTNTANGISYNSSTGMMFLTAGTYSIHFYGGSFAGGLTSAANFKTRFGGVDNATLYIYAIY